MVWAWDEKTGDVALKEVVETYVNETDELVDIYVNGEDGGRFSVFGTNC